MGFLKLTKFIIMLRNIFILICCALVSQKYARAQTEISLNGQWEIIFDEKNEGREANWMKSDIFLQQANKQAIEVPSAWERIKKDYEGVAFYQHTFQAPASWESKVIRLHFGAVNYLAEVWLNDEVVGFHEGGFTPFEFRVDEMIKPGTENILTLRVVGPIILSKKEIDGVKPLETPQWRGGITGGIWQGVKLVATGPVYVDDVFIQPNIHDNTVSFQVEVDHTAIKETTSAITINIVAEENPMETIATIHENWVLHPGRNKQKWTLKIPNTKYWSPDDPYLYRAKVNIVNNAKVSDTWSERFGMRELTIKNKDFYLNGKPIYIKASFFEGLYPNGIAFPDSEEMVRTEIRLAKEAGFNMIRPWRRPPVPMWLDIADEMGVMVVGSPVLECMTLPLSTPYLPDRVKNEVTQSILRDRNRASVVQWELFNELHRPILKQLMRPMAMVARELDPTRLILDESGGWAFGANMYLPEENEPTKFNDIHNYPGPFIYEDKYDGYLSIGMTKEEKKSKGFTGVTPGRNVVPGLMSFVSELGYGSLPNLVENNLRFEKVGNPLTPAYRYHKRLAEEQIEMLKQSGFAELYPNMNQFYLDQQAIHGAANKRMIEAVRANPEVDGYCIHALTAGDWILGAGLIDLWRNPKSKAYEGTKAANKPQIISIRAKSRNVYAEKGMTVEVIGINELDIEKAKLEIRILSFEGDVVYSKVIPFEWANKISTLFNEKIETASWNGTYTIKARVSGKNDSILTENTLDFDVFNTTNFDSQQVKKVAVLNASHSLKAFLKQSGIKTVDFKASLDTSIPVFVTGVTPKDEMSKLFEDLSEFAKSGGTVVLLEGLSESTNGKYPGIPFKATTHPAVGLWTCIPHLVHDHPILEGLPTNTMMRDVYENVWAKITLRDVKGIHEGKTKTLAAAIGFDWFSKKHKMHYSGPGTSWWGSDLAIVPFGKGQYMISQLRLLPNLGKDPVADKILFNMIKYLANNQQQ